MKTLRAFGIYAATVVAVACAVSFPLEAVCQHFGWLEGKPWFKCFSLSAKVTALAGVWPLLRALGMASWEGIGLRARWSPGAARATAGWGVGFAGTMLLGVWAVWAGNRTWEQGPLASLWPALATGVIVAVIEETLFRGVIFGALRREWGAARALWASSVFFGALHFVAAQPKTALATMAAFVSLTCIGAVLAWCYWRSGSLYLSIGVHAGCVTALKWWTELTHRGGAEMDWLFGAGRFRLVSGVGAVPMILLVWLALVAFERALRSLHVGDNEKLDASGSGPVLPG
ncbi:MAG: CPBP family intramembrane metalloprotease [Verrucomicrobia bacterium]|nr:CPBP family intramembrane metalloprotease [Verrucomicrobiota bacterium]